jgi:NAD(P)-dependent dehydrogenase (short-subunit alcohol dehydrogenase family)
MSIASSVRGPFGEPHDGDRSRHLMRTISVHVVDPLTIVVTGSASGIGAATAALLARSGRRIIGVDRRDSDVIVDLGTPAGRRDAVAAILDACGGSLDGLVTCAGLGGVTGRSGSLLVDVNYLGTVELLTELRPALARGHDASAVAIGSNSTTVQPGVPLKVADACLAGELDIARELADEAGALATYPATKLAVSRWIRRQAPSAHWIGAGIRLNAVAPGIVETALVAEQRQDATIGPLLDSLPIPIGRPGQPEEIAAVVAFLLSREASFLCGTIVLADGGTEAHVRPDSYPTVTTPTTRDT